MVCRNMFERKDTAGRCPSRYAFGAKFCRRCDVNFDTDDWHYAGASGTWNDRKDPD